MIYRNDNKPAAAEALFRADGARPLALLRQCPAYAPTPLKPMPQLAVHYGLASLVVKDESARMGLGSFKALGGAYAVARMILEASGAADPTSPEARAVAAGMTFITASAGNHGLSVAAGARLFSAQAAIVLAETVPEAFAERIRGLGAEVIRSPGSYEDSVALAMKLADEHGWLLLADGSWPGYVERPALIMEGYGVLAAECFEQLQRENYPWPSHVFLQAGVGGLAGAMAAHIRAHWPVQPQIIVVEPDAAPCLLESVRKGELSAVSGPVSNMGRLDCKEASLIAFETLRRAGDVFVTICDDQAQEAAHRVAAAGLASTPSGAGAFAAIDQIAPGAEAHVLMVVSEGAA